MAVRSPLGFKLSLKIWRALKDVVRDGEEPAKRKIADEIGRDWTDRLFDKYSDPKRGFSILNPAFVSAAVDSLRPDTLKRIIEMKFDDVSEDERSTLSRLQLELKLAMGRRVRSGAAYAFMGGISRKVAAKDQLWPLWLAICKDVYGGGVQRFKQVTKLENKSDASVSHWFCHGNFPKWMGVDYVHDLMYIEGHIIIDGITNSDLRNMYNAALIDIQLRDYKGRGVASDKAEENCKRSIEGKAPVGAVEEVVLSGYSRSLH